MHFQKRQLAISTALSLPLCTFCSFPIGKWNCGGWKRLTALLVDSAKWLFVDDLCLRVIPGATEFQQASETSITIRIVIPHCIYAYVHSSWWWTLSKQLHICAGSFVSLLRVSFLWLICCVELSNPQRHVASLFFAVFTFSSSFCRHVTSSCPLRVRPYPAWDELDSICVFLSLLPRH